MFPFFHLLVVLYVCILKVHFLQTAYSYILKRLSIYLSLSFNWLFTLFAFNVTVDMVKFKFVLIFVFYLSYLFCVPFFFFLPSFGFIECFMIPFYILCWIISITLCFEFSVIALGFIVYIFKLSSLPSSLLYIVPFYM